MTDTAIISAVGFATLIAGYVWKAFIDARNRRWDIEDRERQWQLASQQRAELAAQVGRQARIVEAAVQESAEANAANTEAAAGKQKLLADVVELQALDTLHHPEQPAFDHLIDKFRSPAEEISDQELVGFIHRLHIIAGDPRSDTAQRPAAKLTLDRALDVGYARGLKIDINDMGANLIAGESMMAEAERQRRDSGDGGEGPPSKPKQ